MRPEYDFSSKGVRGKHAARYGEGTNVVVLNQNCASASLVGDRTPHYLRLIVADKRFRVRKPHTPLRSNV